MVGRESPAAPDAFRDAIEKAFELICTQPNIGAVATNVKLRGVRRILLSRVSVLPLLPCEEQTERG
jgi:plasmid stabilization system protein ParE